MSNVVPFTGSVSFQISWEWNLWVGCWGTRVLSTSDEVLGTTSSTGPCSLSMCSHRSAMEPIPSNSTWRALVAEQESPTHQSLVSSHLLGERYRITDEMHLQFSASLFGTALNIWCRILFANTVVGGFSVLFCGHIWHILHNPCGIFTAFAFILPHSHWHWKGKKF